MTTQKSTTETLQSLLDYAEEKRVEVEAAESPSNADSSWTRGYRTGQVQALSEMIGALKYHVEAGSGDAYREPPGARGHKERGESIRS